LDLSKENMSFLSFQRKCKLFAGTKIQKKFID
jgi:hypothetical protein